MCCKGRVVGLTLPKRIDCLWLRRNASKDCRSMDPEQQRKSPGKMAVDLLESNNESQMLRNWRVAAEIVGNLQH